MPGRADTSVAGQAAVLEHPAARLLLRAVTHHVVLEVDRLDPRAAARARARRLGGAPAAASAACPAPWRRSPPRSGRAPPPADSAAAVRSRLASSPARGRTPCGTATGRPSTGSRPPTSARSRRSCAGRAAAGAGGGADRSARRTRRHPARARPRGRAWRRPRRPLWRRWPAAWPRPVAGCRTRAGEARGRPSSAQQQPRRLVAQRGALVPHLQAPRGHQVDQQRQVARARPRTSCPRRRTPSISRPTSASSGGSKVFIVTMPGASADSTRAPATAAFRRRALISTSGSSGMPRGYASAANARSTIRACSPAGFSC